MLLGSFYFGLTDYAMTSSPCENSIFLAEWFDILLCRTTIDSS
jgi:hypothetical protein